jgi:hypothetical protein
MALPNFGVPLSLNMIATELVWDNALSLRDMSVSAGKTAPHSISEFYGYSATPISYTYSIVAYNGYTTVQGTYTTKAGVPNTTFSFYNSSGSGGVVGSVCAQSGTVTITSGNGTKTQGSTC